MKVAPMILNTTSISIRPAGLNDVSQLCKLLNEIIRIGGTTAIETPLTDEEFVDYFLLGSSLICCYVAEDNAGFLVGFQALEQHSELPDDWASIATFARINPKISGVGTSLFPKSKTHAIDAGITAINATIRADNMGGLAYYDKMGFETYSIKKGVPLKDGTPVDRISKRLVLNA